MPEQPTWRQVIQREAEAAGVPPALAFAIVEQESSSNPAAMGQEVPGQGRAQGFFQLMPATAQGLGVNPADPYQNIRGGVKLLSELHGRYGNDVSAIIAGYHGGTDLAQHGPKTQQYVKDVLGRLQGAEAPAGVSGAPEKPSEPIKGAAAPSATSAAPTSPAAIRFGGELGREVLTGITAPISAVMHPLQTVEALKQNYAAQSEAAKKAYQEGDYTTAAVRGLGSVLPPVAELGDIAAQATEGDYAGAAGRAVGFGLAPRIFAGAPRAVRGAARGVSRTAQAVSENPIPTAAGAGLGYHYGGLPGAVAGGLTGALTGEVALGRTGLTHAIARALLKKADEAPTKVAAGTEVAAESPLVNALIKRSAAEQGVEIPRNLVLTPEEFARLDQLRQAMKPGGSAIGAAYQRFGQGGVR